MKTISLTIALLSTILLVSCDPLPFAQQVIAIAEQKNIKICTKGTSTACDIKTRLDAKDLVLVLAPTNGDTQGSLAEVDEYLTDNTKTDIAFIPYNEIDGRFVLSVRVGNETKYIGVESSDWEGLKTELEGQNLAQQVHTLTKFFQANFDEFGWLTESGSVTTTYNMTTDIIVDPATGVETPVIESRTVTYQTFTYFDGTENVAFSEEGAYKKDLESMGAEIEAVRFTDLAERLEANYGLSTERAMNVAKNISAYNKLTTKRALTSREHNFFAKELLGVNYKNARNAFLSGDKKDLDNLLETAAKTNETSPEQISAIINEVFL